MGIRSLSAASISTGAKRSKFWDQSTTPVIPNSYNSIASTTLSSNANTIDLTSIPGTYKHLQIRGIFNSTAVQNGTPRFTFNGDSNTNYSIHTIRNSTIDNYNGLGSAYMSLDVQQPGFFTCFVLDIFDYTDTNKFKTFQFRQAVANYTDSVFYNIFGTGHYRSLSAITSFSLIDQQVSDLTALSTIALYGIEV